MKAAQLWSALTAHAAQPALSDQTQTLSGQEVLAAVDNMTQRLAHCRVIAILADNSIDWVLSDLAALMLGVVHLPLPTFFSAAQLVNALTQTDADAVLTDQPERITALGLGFACRTTCGALSLMCRPVEGTVALPTGCAKISFTSGSTGSPKGVCLSATGLMATAKTLQSTLSPLGLTQHLAVLPLSLLLENTAGIYAALLNGVHVHVTGLASLGWRGMAGFDPVALQQHTMTSQPHSLILVPELLKAWLLFLQASRQRAPDSLRFVAVGGAHVAPALIAQARQVGIPAYEGYGLTECGSVVSLNLPGDDGNGVGRILPHVQLRLVDGEVHLQTAAFLGYTGNPAQSSQRRHDLATGDLGRLDAQGHLHLMGRRKNMLITSFGRNISPEWVESVLLAQAPLQQAVVLGEARPWLLALVVPLPGTTPTQMEAAMAQANAQLPDYARIKRWHSCPPMTLANGLATGNGRPLRTAIAQHFAPTIDTLYNNEEATA
ncbi:MAG: AMP-dependent synthetase [Comamonadaceae bacterium CG1_02_60_18]|nr:MAG: AMP-dependent synthetase [Comamonadaceae bacterium CG1_02_60_18]PIQ52144.1 MAG: AMP-dependent synthetase [Comamonadaceae bacterium CG12_big_fil_rev_8_21_14_0_65_59_15]